MDVATLGIRVDSQGAVVNVQRFRGELTTLGEHSGAITHKLQHMSTSIGFAIAGMANDSERGVGRVLHQFGYLGFMINPLVGGITTALGSIADVMLHDSSEMENATKKMADDLVALEHQFTESAKRIRIAALEMRIGRLMNENEAVGDRSVRHGSEGWGDVWMNWQKMFEAGDINTELAKTIKEVGDLRVELTNAGRDAQKKFSDEVIAGMRKARDAVDDFYIDLLNKQSGTPEGAVKNLIQLIGNDPFRSGGSLEQSLHEGAARAASREQHDMNEQQKRDMDEILFRLQEQLKVINAQIDAEKEKGRLRQQALIGAAAGIGSVLVGGAVGSVLQGAIGGIPGGAIGISAGAFAGLLKGILDTAAAAKAHQEALRQLAAEYGAFVDTVREKLGQITSLDKQIADIRRQYAQMEAAIWNSGMSNAEMAAKLNDLEALRQAEEAFTREEDARRKAEFAQDTEIRFMRAAGMDEEAKALERQIRTERELNDARKAGASEATLQMIAEISRLEAIGEAMEKTKQKIDALSSTIEGLRGFRDALLLSDSRSPADRYAEAKRQYTDVLEQALTGDQAAAGRLPTVAQTFLDASRALYASGSDFQKDFQKVLTDTQSAIDKFTDLKTIEQLMLDELQKSRDAIVEGNRQRDEVITQLHDGIKIIGIGDIGGGGGGGGILDLTKRHLEISTEGFTQMATAINGLRGDVQRTNKTLEGLPLLR